MNQGLPPGSRRGVQPYRQPAFPQRRRDLPRRLGRALWLPALLLALAGCHHQRQVAYAPAPPSTHSRAPAPAPPRAGGFFDDTRVPPVFTETGMATWYHAHGHTGADGVRYEASAPTAAHKTLPLGSTVRVTNLVTGESAFVRITDRGPFVRGRILDLSEVAAKEIGLYRLGIAKVRIEAYPHPLADPLGRWCVQTGPFHAVGDALDLKNALVERYRGARVAEFTGQTGYWVRIDPVNRGKADAAKIADWIGAPDAQTNSFVVRVN